MRKMCVPTVSLPGKGIPWGESGHGVTRTVFQTSQWFRTSPGDELFWDLSTKLPVLSQLLLSCVRRWWSFQILWEQQGRNLSRVDNDDLNTNKTLKIYPIPLPHLDTHRSLCFVMKVRWSKLCPGHWLHPSNLLPPHPHSWPTGEVSSSQHQSTSCTTRFTAGLVPSLQKHDINTDTGHHTHQQSQTLLMNHCKIPNKQTNPLLSSVLQPFPPCTLTIIHREACCLSPQQQIK